MLMESAPCKSWRDQERIFMDFIIDLQCELEYSLLTLFFQVHERPDLQLRVVCTSPSLVFSFRRQTDAVISYLPVDGISMYYLREDVGLRGLPLRLIRVRRSKPAAWMVATLVCLALIAFLTVIQVVHVHAADSDADHCPLCAAMHSVVPCVVLLAAVVLVKIGTAAAPLRAIPAPIRYWHPTLFSRPPPSSF